LVQIGALIAPRDGIFKVLWNDLNTMTEGEQYSVARERMGLMQSYATTPELQNMISPQDMMQIFVGMSEEEASGILANAGKHTKGEERKQGVGESIRKRQ
jgi:type IV secretory pathway TraG/TraD family ATPase VirD4